jgi:hypothetical protein
MPSVRWNRLQNPLPKIFQIYSWNVGKIRLPIWADFFPSENLEKPSKGMIKNISRKKIKYHKTNGSLRNSTNKRDGGQGKMVTDISSYLWGTLNGKQINFEGQKMKRQTSNRQTDQLTDRKNRHDTDCQITGSTGGHGHTNGQTEELTTGNLII